MEIVIAVAAKFVECTVCPIVRSIARRCPFKNLWEYKSNLDNLKKEVEKLEEKRESVQRLTNVGVEPLPDVKAWQNDVTNIIREVLRLTSENNPEQQSMECCKGCTYSNLKECYQHRNNVARKLEDVAQLLQEAMKSKNLWEYKSNLENLKQEVEKLVAGRERVQCLIKVGEEPLQSVKIWEDNVKKIIDEVSGLATSEHNPKQQNEVTRMLKEVAQLLQEAAQFREVSYQPIPEHRYFQPSIQQESSESRMSILKDIIAALTKADVNKVGIYGMGGIGKTTLAKKVGDQAIQDKFFDKIVFVEVSQSPDIRTIQGVIAHDLHLKFEEETIPGRAIKLCNVLKKEEKILIILDNLWKEIKLEDVGIPLENKGLKLLLTARSRDVLTKWMKSQPNFHVETLSEEDAWTLFKSTAGTCVDHPHLNSVARQVAKKCAGMPLAIVTVARALKDTKAKKEWEDALQRFGRPSLERFGGITKEVYSRIKLSYDYLREKRIKEIFLLCSRMGCTYNASVQDLFRYGLGLGFFDNTVEAALCNVYESVNKLKTASLLLDAPMTEAFRHRGIPALERFAIHDVICGVARSIALEEQHVFTVQDGHVPRQWTNGETLKNCTSITLYNVDELSKDLRLVCPNLKFLYMKLKNSYLTIPNNFFIGMSSLQVLHLILIDLKPLPSSLSCLVNLQALCLDHCQLGDVAAIGDMNKLEVLSFCGSDITMLPKEMCQLTKLRLLDLTDCSNLSVIPSKVISCLTGIEALYMNKTSIKWEDARPSIDELKHLRRLTTLEISIPASKMFRGLISSEPERYKISIGYFLCGPMARKLGAIMKPWEFRKPYSNISRRFLRLKLDTKEDWIISQLPGVEELELEGDVVGAMNLLDDLGRNGFPRLMHLDVASNNHCVCIVNSLPGAVLPSLESLVVKGMGSLKKICENPLGAESFLNLKTIRVKYCDKLSNIFCFFSIVGDLPNLIDLEVSDCKNMEEIFAIEEQDDGNSADVVHDIKFNQLSRLRLTNLPKLKSFCCKAKTAFPLQLASDTSAGQIFSAKDLNNHSSLFNEKVASPNLQDLEVSEIHQIEQIWPNLLPTSSSCVQNLTRLRVSRCDNLKELFSFSVTISEEAGEKERKDTIVFPKLYFLVLEDLTKLKRLCSGYNIEFPSLEEFEIQSCPQLKKFIFYETVANPNLMRLRVSELHQIEQIWPNLLPTSSSCVQNLTRLRVSRCDNLKELFSFSVTISEEAGEKERNDTIVFPKLYFLVLEDLTKLKRLCSGYNIEFPSLEEFEIQSCPQLKKFIFYETVANPNLMRLRVSELHQIEQIWPNLLPTSSSCVQNLTSLNVCRCDNLKELFSFSVTISEEAGEKERRDTIVFPKLYFLVLKDLTKLKRLCSGYNIKFPSLEEFKIQSCPQLKKFIFYETVANPNLMRLRVSEIHQIEQIWPNLLPTSSSCVQNLTSLSVCRCDNLKELFSFSVTISKEAGEKERRDTIVFPKLYFLVLEDLTRLKRLCSGYNIEFPSLKEFEIRSCLQLKEFIFDETVKAPNLEELRIFDMDNLEMIWHNKLTEDSFSMLKSLEVTKCHKLLAVFSSNMCGRLLSLESLNVDDCYSLVQICDIQGINSEEYEHIPFMNLKELEVLGCPSLKYIFAKEGVVAKEVPARLVFPKLTSLKLNRPLYPGKHTVEGPILKKLELCDSGIHHTDEEGQMQQPLLYLVQPVFPCLEELKLLEKELMMIGQAQVPECLFPKLKILDVYGLESTVFPLGIIQRFQNLEKLSLTGGEDISFCKERVHQTHASSYKEIFFYGEDQTQAVPLAKMKTLFLQYLGDLKYMWERDSKWDLIFQNLEVLTVDTCNNLVNLMPPSASFQNLTILNVRNCNSLETIVTTSMANSLMKLETMCISHCPKITEVIQNHGEVTEKIIFSNLKTLKLIEADNLTSFCSCNFTLEFPSLEKLKVCSCRNMKTFSQGDLIMPKLQEVRINKESFRLRLDTNLNTIIQQFHAERDAHSSVLVDEKIQRLDALSSEAQRSATFRHQDKMTYATSDDLEELNETVAATITKTQLDAGHVSASTTETVAEEETVVPLKTDTLPIDECGTQHTSETEGKLIVQVAGTVKTISDENKRKLPINESEFKTVPSQTEGESKINVKQSVKPAGPVATSIASPSDTTEAEPVIVFPPREKDEILATTEAATVISFDSKGDEWLLGSGLDVKSSIKRTVLKIIRCMSDVEAGKIGVHGIGGIGKTSVLKALISYPKIKGIFDLIILVSVSRYWSVKKIQNEVIKQLSLSREDSETDSQVAKKLFEILSGKKFLLLLDDVWESIDFKAVGIPDSENGCKIVVASSKLNVCYDLDVFRVIEVETMSREEAYELFSEQVGRVSASPDIQPFVNAIVKGCGGLPLLTIVTGRALTEENNVTVWEHASKKFQLTGTATRYDAEDVIQLLKFSFDRLTDYDMQSCFLYCCLFSEDKEIRIVEFIEHCIQEGLIDGRWGRAHKRGLDMVDVLERAFLVEVTEGGDTIKMHDSIRDLALGILSSGRQYLLKAYSRSREPLNPGSSLSLECPRNSRLLIPEAPQCILRAGAGLTEPPLEEEWKQAKMIFLMDNNLCTLPQRPNCPELLTLFLQRNYQLRVIPPSFFELMTSLKELNLSKTRVKSLPTVLFHLKDLQVLILRDCERLVMLPPAVGCLKCLEVLDLQGTEISELPNEIGNLASLRHLKVSLYSEYFKLPHELISGGILSRLRALESLSIVVHPGDQRWYKDVESVIKDISKLTELTSLCFQFPQVEHLELFLERSTAWNAQHLTEFKFVVGHQVKSITSRVPHYVEFDYSQQRQCLRFVNGERIPDVVLKILARSSAFFLDQHLGICSLSDFGVSNINGLKLCIISECPKIEKVVDSRNLTTTVFPWLERLSIHHLWNLICIWEGIVPKGSFAALKLLSVCACPKLKYVFSSSMIQFVPNLEELAVEDCPAIEEIVLEGEIIDSDGILLPNLKKLTLHYLPGLVNIWKSAWPSLEHVSFYNCPRLKNIGIDSRSIREIEAEKSWWDELEWEDTAVQLRLQKSLSLIHEDD